jgi:hypothetical protein
MAMVTNTAIAKTDKENAERALDEAKQKFQAAVAEVLKEPLP